MALDASLDQLRTLAAVVDEGTFEGAATVLRITPSAVSQRIRALEKQAGRVLLTRSKPVRTTPPGDVVLRLARLVTRLAADAMGELGAAEAATGFTTIPVAVNNDSLAGWFLEALARMPARHRVCFDIHADDQEFSYRLFASEAVLAAVTSIAEPVPGCSVTPLGSMTYHATASADFAASHLGDDAALAVAPVVQFDRRDSLQNTYLAARLGPDFTPPPAHYVPSSPDYTRAVQLGLGWGMLPDLPPSPPGLVRLPGDPVTVDLYWQCWNVDSPALRALTDVVTRTAAELLDAPR